MKPPKVKLPIMKLPFLALENFYEHLQFVDLMNLSQCSRRLKNYLLSLEKSSKKTVTCEVSIRPTRRMIRLERQGWEDFAWSSHSPRNRYFPDAKVFIDRVINGIDWRVSPWKSGWMTLGINDDQFLFWFEYFKKVFNCRISHLEIEVDGNVDFEKLFGETLHFRKADKISVLPTTLTEDEMHLFFDNFEAEELIMNAETSMDYVYPDLITSFAKLNLPKVSWLTITDIWRMAQSGVCKQMTLDSVPVTNALINELINNWLASDNRTLETIKLGHYSATDLTHNEVFNGIAVLPGARKRREAAEYFNDSIRYEDGRDIRRQDDLLATVNIVARGKHRGFHFTVWYDQNPNV